MPYDPEKINPELKETVRRAKFTLQVAISAVFFGLMIGGFIILYYKMM